MPTGETADNIIVLMDPPSFKEKDFQISQYSTPNVGMAYVAAVLRASGYAVRALDPRIENLSPGGCMELLRQIRPRFIGLSAMTHNIVDAGRIAAAIKMELPGTTTVLGGLHVSVEPLETMSALKDIDYAVFGEGEQTSVELFDTLTDRTTKDISELHGVAARLGKDVAVNEKRTGYANLDTLPYPAWDIFPLDLYSPLYGLCTGKRQLPIYSSRGCPFDCSFCNNINGRQMRYRKTSMVLDEMEDDIERLRAGSFHFVDEAATFDMDRSSELFRGMIERNISDKVKWLCMTRADKISPDILTLMKSAGCEYISIGIESGNQNILDLTGKKLKLEKARAAIDMITRADITADALFLIGLPYETPKTIMETIMFARSLNTKHATFANVVPYPGTRVYEMGLKGEGGIKALSRDWSLYDKHTSYAMELESVSAGKLKFYHFLAYIFFYFKPGRFSEFVKKVKFTAIPFYLFNMIRPSKRPRSSLNDLNTDNIL
jgi:anaerobic magnesium-protoporphyrin IX monomethyl ester cyclase